MKYEYDIAISYKSEIEKKAAKIADYLTADGWKVFFAPFDQQELLSEKISQKLYDIYKNKSLMKILLISEAYVDGEWTALEKRVSLESTKDNRKKLLIVNYTDQLFLPAELEELQYLDGRKLKEDQIACIATERLNKYIKVNIEKATDKASALNKTGNVVINKGIIAGDNASFKNIRF